MKTKTHYGTSALKYDHYGLGCLFTTGNRKGASSGPSVGIKVKPLSQVIQEIPNLVAIILKSMQATIMSFKKTSHVM